MKVIYGHFTLAVKWAVHVLPMHLSKWVGYIFSHGKDRQDVCLVADKMGRDLGSPKNA